MGGKPNDSEPAGWASLTILLLGLVSCSLVYMFMSVVMRPNNNSEFDSVASVGADSNGVLEGDLEGESGGCCRGIENLELWGPAVKWGSDFKFNSSKECCEACKALCTGNDGPCLCDSWVFCGNREACGPKFGECWLKKQKDTLVPDRQEAGNTVSWTSGLIFGKGELTDFLYYCTSLFFFLVGYCWLGNKIWYSSYETFPEYAPHSVDYILELLGLRHCAGCQFYRAENRGEIWDSDGSHIKDASYGPPFALIQGTLDAQGIMFNKIPTEVCRTIRRDSVAWVGSGPEFFISLANHQEWKRSYTVFGSVLPEDMEIAKKIAQRPMKSDVWSNINVSVLENPVPLFRRIKTSHGDSNTNNNAGSD